MHIAITHGAEEEVLQLFDEVAKNTSTAREALKARNKLGNTPLHCAAWRGFRQICERIARVHESLVFERNKEGETPLFLAALYGRKEAFLYLDSVCFGVEECPTTELRMPWRREDGDTILHVTIQREYFELASLIIHRYKEDITLPQGSNNTEKNNVKTSLIVTSVNAKGMTPLHVLANTPSAFKSATGLRWWDKLLYYWLPVKQLEDRSSSQTAVDIKDEKRQKSIDTKKQPSNSCTCFTCKALQPLRLSGSCCLERIRKIKQKHEWGAQIMDLPLEHYKYQFMEGGSRPFMELIADPEDLKKIEYIGLIADLAEHRNIESTRDDKSTPFLLAAKYGVIELVSKILCVVPVAIYDRTAEHKNAVLLAVEKRQLRILEKLRHYDDVWDTLIQEVDVKGNNVLHLAAQSTKYKPWEIPGSAMQWKIKWYRFVQAITPQHLRFQTDNDGKTPDDIFAEKNTDLVRESSEWFKKTSESYSVVAVLIAGATFATSITIPGGSDDKTGLPILDGQPAFHAFAVSSLISLCFTLTSLVMFLMILTSRKQPKHFLTSLPLKLLFGLSSMFVSIASMLVSFCTAHFYEFEHRYKNGAVSIYTVTCLPVLFYAISQFPLYMDILKATFRMAPLARYVEDL